ncbi:hypothetical protein BN1723_017445, partial [Verticillium longisporum]
MSTGLKNAGSIIPDVLEDVHFSVNEQCVQFSECETFAPFIKDNKPVFHIEYPKDAPSVSSAASKRVCTPSGEAAGTDGFSTPEAGASWQIVLIKPIEVPASGDVTPDVDAFDIDLFDNSDETFSRLREAGKKVICYFSAGSWEDWRDDKDDFGDENLGKELDGWPGEKWVDVASDGVRNVMKKRIQLAANRGCDAIDPDNVDGFV